MIKDVITKLDALGFKRPGHRRHKKVAHWEDISLRIGDALEANVDEHGFITLVRERETVYIDKRMQYSSVTLPMKIATLEDLEVMCRVLGIQYRESSSGNP